MYLPGICLLPARTIPLVQIPPGGAKTTMYPLTTLRLGYTYAQSTKYLTLIDPSLVVVSVRTLPAPQLLSELQLPYRNSPESRKRMASQPSVSYSSSPLEFNWPTLRFRTLPRPDSDRIIYDSRLRFINEVRLTNLLI